ncbi:Hypothetical protein CINCED_3A015484 [Cinara cedri]|uniref:FAST kinase leucine-rich domain-containing protein n=1 Tax=Cinara cedri TaxID=506608 RepID=A0A5E4NDG3_9HEMI|nr:Hypothetical protein CINCED_3A015484 [Cinara cedri]
MISKKNIFSMMYCQSLILTNKNYSLQTLNLNKSYSTFHKWILDFFKNHPKYNEFVLKKPTLEVNMSDYKYVQLKTIPTDELLNKFSFGCSKPFHYKIDQELLNRINDMSINQILVLMDTCLSEKNKLSTKSVSFKKCLDLMDELWFRRPDLTASQTIQLLYYVSIYKKKAKPTVEFGLQKLMNEINYLKQSSDEELSVLALTTFKSNAKVYDKMLRIFAYRLEKNLSKLIQNPMHFVSLIKPLKKAKYHDQILLTKLTTTFSNNINKASHGVISSVHLLTYLADANYGDVIFLQQLIDSIGNCMIKDNLKNYRIKDVSNYLFSVSYLGLTPKDPNVGKIINDFMNQLFYTKEKCQSQSKLLIGMCLSMWMLDYKPIQLMKFMFSEISIAALRMPNAHKLHNRLDLLLTCASIEQPNLIIQYQLVKNALNVMPESFKHLAKSYI